MAAAHVSIRRHFANLKDPRINRHKRHLLLDVIVIAICAVICGCDTWQQIELFGQRRHDWLKRFLKLPNGIPSHDTFERIFDRLNPAAFQSCFQAWIQAISAALPIRQIAIDGKTLRRSGRPGRDLGPLHVVSAWATEQHLSLGQVAVTEKSNEIPAIPKLLELLDLHGALVTLDAMGCQRDIAEKILEGGGDYVLTVKDNQPKLLDAIQDCFQNALEGDFAGVDHDEYETEASGHGRHEKRSYLIIREPAGMAQAWPGLKVIGMCCSERTVQGTNSSETRYFIGSKKAGARTYGRALRHHWGIENSLHWQLDISFGEDDSRISKRQAAENFSWLRRLALMLLKRHPAKRSIPCKRLAAALDTDFLEEVLSGGRKPANL